MVKDFDIASTNYDISFTFSNIGKAQRRMVYNHLNSILKQDKELSILELNCGTVSISFFQILVVLIVYLKTS